MTRICLTDGSGRWFDAEKAEKFVEETEWNGSNHISKATGSQWEHETLYKTVSGQFVLNHWSNRQGTLETYELLSSADAAKWLAINKYEADELCAEEFAALEIK